MNWRHGRLESSGGFHPRQDGIERPDAGGQSIPDAYGRPSLILRGSGGTQIPRVITLGLLLLLIFVPLMAAPVGHVPHRPGSSVPEQSIHVTSPSSGPPYTPEESERLTARAFLLFVAEWAARFGVLAALLFTSTLSRRRIRWGEGVDRWSARLRLDRAARPLAAWTIKLAENNYRALLVAGRERRWRERLKSRLLSDPSRTSSRVRLATGRAARWRGMWKVSSGPSAARRRRMVKAYSLLGGRRARRIHARLVKYFVAAKDAFITIAMVFLSLAATAVIFDVLRYFQSYEIPSDTYMAWSTLFIPERVALICALTVALAALYSFLSGAGRPDALWKRAMVGALCGALAWVYIFVSFQLPKGLKYDDRVNAPLADASEISSDAKARLVAFAAQHGISEGQLFVVRGKRGDILNAYAKGSGAEAGIFFTARLLREMPAEEVVFVAAHELGHVNDRVYRHETEDYVLLASASFCLLISFASWAFLQFDRLWALKNTVFGATGFLVCLILVNLYLLVLPALYNVLSWRAERYADSHAVRLTIVDEASRRIALNAFARLAASSPLDPDPPFYIQLMLNDHPPIVERQRHVLSYRPPDGGRRAGTVTAVRRRPGGKASIQHYGLMPLSLDARSFAKISPCALDIYTADEPTLFVTLLLINFTLRVEASPVILRGDERILSGPVH